MVGVDMVRFRTIWRMSQQTRNVGQKNDPIHEGKRDCQRSDQCVCGDDSGAAIARVASVAMKHGQTAAIEECGDEIVAHLGGDEERSDADSGDAFFNESMNDSCIKRGDCRVSSRDAEGRRSAVGKAMRTRFEMAERTGTVHDDEAQRQRVQRDQRVNGGVEAARVDRVRAVFHGERGAAQLDDELDAARAFLGGRDVRMRVVAAGRGRRGGRRRFRWCRARRGVPRVGRTEPVGRPRKRGHGGSG